MRIREFKKQAAAYGVHPDYVSSLFYGLYRESARMSDLPALANPGPMHPSIQDSPETVYDKLRGNLIALTRSIAPVYEDTYGRNAVATQLCIDFEQRCVREIASRLASDFRHIKALDLGCATGSITGLLSEYFDIVEGFDISPDMVSEARKRHTDRGTNATFEVMDLNNGLNCKPNSVAMVTMTLGTASDILNLDQLLDSIQTSLVPGGRYFLSFYNADALMYNASLPWQPPLAASYNTQYEYLNVNGYAIFARRYTKEEVERHLARAKLVPETWLSYPTIASILPNEALSSEDVKQAISHADDALSQTTAEGVYISVSGIKQ